jgi:hypothetical protein
MSSELINLFLDQFNDPIIQQKNVMKEFYNLILQDIGSNCVNIIYDFSNINKVLSFKYCYYNNITGLLENYSITSYNLSNFELINDLYIFENMHVIFIMTKEMYEKILNSSNNLN